MTKVKICGLKRLDDALVAVDAGADFLGFVFAPSRRQVTAEAVRDIISEIRVARPSMAASSKTRAARPSMAASNGFDHENMDHTRPPIKIVGVFVNAEPDEMNRLVKFAGLDYVQLHGDEPGDMPAALEAPAIQAIRISSSMTADALNARIEESQAEMLLFDTGDSNSYGGTGRTFDWNRVPRLDRPVLVAGGLNIDNVHEALRGLKPWGVDVSSGVETDGAKDQKKIRSFIQAVRSHDP